MTAWHRWMEEAAKVEDCDGETRSTSETQTSMTSSRQSGLCQKNNQFVWTDFLKECFGAALLPGPQEGGCDRHKLWWISSCPYARWQVKIHLVSIKAARGNTSSMRTLIFSSYIMFFKSWKLTKLILKWYGGRDLGRLLRCGVLTSPIFDWRYLGNFTIHLATIIIKHSNFKEISTIFENMCPTLVYWIFFLPHHKIGLFVCRHHNHVALWQS